MKTAKWIILGVVIAALIFGVVYQNSRIERLESRMPQIGIYTESNGAADIAAHAAIADAHHAKYTDAEADARADAKITTHTAIATAHQDAPALILTHKGDASAHHVKTPPFWEKDILVSFGESKDGWIESNLTGGSETAGLGGLILATGATSGARAQMWSASTQLSYAKAAIFHAYAYLSTSTNQVAWFGVGDRAANIQSFSFKIVNGTLYAATCDGTTEGITEITGVTVTLKHRYRIEFNPGVDCKFYVDDVLETTRTTNLPTTSGGERFFLHIENTAAENKELHILALYHEQDW